MPASKSSSAATTAFLSTLDPNRQEVSAATLQSQAGTKALASLEAMLEFKSNHIVDNLVDQSQYDNAASICQDSLIIAGYEDTGKQLAGAFGKLYKNYTELNSYYDPSKTAYAGFEKEEERLQSKLDEAMDRLKRAALVSWFEADRLGSVAPEVLGERTEVDKIFAQGYKVIGE
jgi:hypothetical protein